MRELTKKQKIIVITIIGILIGAIIYYVYGKEEPTINTNELIPYENLENETTKSEETNNEKDTNDKTLENEKEIIIYITGEVEKEGVYPLKEGSRIADAIEKAEGLTEEADTSNINLAYIIEDGMKIKIPNKKEAQNIINNQTGNNESNTNIEKDRTQEYITKNSGLETYSDSQSNSKDSDIVTKKAAQEKININTATQEQLETLTGIGPTIASKIIQYRKENGSFKTIEELKNVSGIGDSKFVNIKENITIK